MSPEAITARMEALDQLWELAVALRDSEIIIEKTENKDSLTRKDEDNEQK